MTRWTLPLLLLMAARLGEAQDPHSPFGAIKGTVCIDGTSQSCPDSYKGTEHIFLTFRRGPEPKTVPFLLGRSFTVNGFMEGLWRLVESGWCQQNKLNNPPETAKATVSPGSLPQPLFPDKVYLVEGCTNRTTTAKLRFSPAGSPEARLVLVSWTPPTQQAQAPAKPETGGPSGPRPSEVWRGVVRDEGAKGIRGALITLQALNASGDQVVPILRRRTGKGGRFTIERPGGTRPVVVISVEKAGYEPFILTEWPGKSGNVMLKKDTDPPRATRLVATTDEIMRRYVMDDTVIQNLPLPGIRSFDALALLAPGVLPAPQTFGRTGPGISPGVGSAGQFAVNGLRSRENNFVIDGSDNNDEEVGARRQGYVSPVPQSMESMESYYIVTALPDARYGRNIGGQVSALSKSGTQQFHSDWFGFLTNQRLDARDFFDTAGRLPEGAPTINGAPIAPFAGGKEQDPFTRSQFGATLGGLVPTQRILSRKNEIANTYFYVSGERQLIRATRTSHFAVPTAAERRIGSTLPQPAGLFASSLPGDAIYSLFPFPNNANGPYGNNTYSALLPADANGRLVSARLDQPFAAWSRQNQLSFRYAVTDEKSIVPSVGDAFDSSIRPNSSTKNLALSHDVNLHADWTNTFRFSFGKTVTHFDEVRTADGGNGAVVPFALRKPLLLDVSGAGQPAQYVTAGSATGRALMDAAGLPGVTSTDALTGTVGRVSLAGYSDAGVDPFHFPQKRAHHTYQFADTMSLFKTAYSVAAGFDIRRVWLASTMERDARPALDFHGMRGIDGSVFSATTLAALGVPAALLQTLAVAPDVTGAAASAASSETELGLRKSQADFFVQYQTRLSKTLSVSLGGRIGLNRAPKSLDTQLTHAYQTSVVSSASFGDIFGHDRVGNDVRAGLAWRPAARTTVRVGAGTYTSQFPAIVFTESGSSYPDFLPLNVAAAPAQFDGRYLVNLAGASAAALPASMQVIHENSLNLTKPGITDPLQLLVSNLAAVDPILFLTQPAARVKNAYSIQQGITIEHELSGGFLISASYVGTFGRKLLRPVTPFGGASRAAVEFTGISNLSGTSFPSMIGDLQPVQVPASNGLRVGRLLYEGTGNSSYRSVQLNLRTRGNRWYQFGTAVTYSRALDDVSDFFDLSGAYALPENSQQRREWGPAAFDTRIRAATHFVISPPFRKEHKLLGGWQLAGVHVLQTGQPFTVNSTIDVNGDGNLTDRPEAGTVQQVSTSQARVVLASGPGGGGHIGRNTFRSFGLHNLDVALSKPFPITENTRLLFRCETFNLFNSADFAIPSRFVEAPAFGKATRTLAPARIIQLVVKLSF